MDALAMDGLVDAPKSLEQAARDDHDMVVEKNAEQMIGVPQKEGEPEA
jgi:hypothetical protein